VAQSCVICPVHFGSQAMTQEWPTLVSFALVNRKITCAPLLVRALVEKYPAQLYV
jgi:hypothetical protein